MPRPELNDYVFYKIINDDLPEYIYIGSTACFSKRKGAHRGTCNNPYDKRHNLKLYQIIRENGGWEKWDMLVIDKLDQTTLLNARIKEESLRKEYNGNLNSNKAYRSDEEKKEYWHSDRAKEYKQKNKELIAEKKKIYNETNKEAISEKWNEYYKKNKKAIAEQQKKHYESNKEAILEKRKVKMTCECGSVFTLLNKNRHLDTLKHQRFCQPIDLST